MILLPFSSTKLDSTIPASSIVSRNSTVWPACAVARRPSWTLAALEAIVVVATSGKRGAVGSRAVAASVATMPCQRSTFSAVPVSRGWASVPLTTAARRPSPLPIAVAESNSSPSGTSASTTSSGNSPAIRSRNRRCARKNAALSGPLMATPSWGLSSDLATWLPIPPASPPTSTGNSGPSRKNRNVLEKITATKSRRAITQAERIVRNLGERGVRASTSSA